MADQRVTVLENTRGTRPDAVAALGICLVGYGILAGLWPARHGYSPDLSIVIREWVNKPLGIGEDFGFLGVTLLLVTGGMIATPTLVRRLGPPLAAGVALGAVAMALGAHPLVELVRPVAAVLLFVVIWTLTRRWPWLSVVLQLEVAYLLVFAGAAPGADALLHHLGLVAEYLPALLIGQLIRLGTLRALALGVLCVGLPAVAEHLYQELSGWWHALTVVYAVLLTLLLRGRGIRFPVVRWLSTRAGWLFASVAVVGYVALDLLSRLPLVVALVVALGLVGFAAEGGYRLAERVYGP
ncbi:hypothetical protein [Actinocrispum wychmicini]|uniref:Uncharacterized protein n=1 Tax=Actinocrispum wychmicini TaxID=1213861 RepID=A0A4R2K466_9PSEU|nr:hypothetical protein [Actinocrispum wychmicini]TCO64578.1 hypothetical protein EV192_101355 [Actinocrispum wychmicini]